jgi:hypothetical protein
MKLAAGLIGGALILALALGVWLGAGFLHQEPQPRTQLTVRLDTDAVPQLVVRTLFATGRASPASAMRRSHHPATALN